MLWSVPGGLVRLVLILQRTVRATSNEGFDLRLCDVYEQERGNTQQRQRKQEAVKQVLRVIDGVVLHIDVVIHRNLPWKAPCRVLDTAQLVPDPTSSKRAQT